MNKQTTPSNTSSTITTADMPHPFWCDRRECKAIATELHHKSTPTRFETTDAVYELALTRLDMLAFPEEWDEAPTLSFEVTSKAFVVSPADPTPLQVVTDLDPESATGLIAAVAAQITLAGRQVEVSA